jgi:hypothetical protein
VIDPRQQRKNDNALFGCGSLGGATCFHALLALVEIWVLGGGETDFPVLGCPFCLLAGPDRWGERSDSRVRRLGEWVSE